MNDGYTRKILQYPAEIEAFTRLVRKENVRNYLEVGCKFGGSLWRVATAMPKASRIVAVDLPHGDTSFKESQPHLEACIARLKQMGFDAHLFLGDSTDPEIVTRVRELGPFDLCLIDGNHTEPYVRRDWLNYGSLARMVAFHDIAWKAGNRPPSKKYPIQVPKVWEELKQSHKHIEIKLDPTRQDNGFGILWR
jgi:predicted O-methyltransferase YrrM